MHIVSLFCEIDDFFLALIKHRAEYHLQPAEPPETRGRPQAFTS